MKQLISDERVAELRTRFDAGDPLTNTERWEVAIAAFDAYLWAFGSLVRERYEAEKARRAM